MRLHNRSPYPVPSPCCMCSDRHQSSCSQLYFTKKVFSDIKTFVFQGLPLPSLGDFSSASVICLDINSFYTHAYLQQPDKCTRRGTRRKKQTDSNVAGSLLRLCLFSACLRCNELMFCLVADIEISFHPRKRKLDDRSELLLVSQQCGTRISDVETLRLVLYLSSSVTRTPFF